MGGIDLIKFANWLESYDKDRNVTTVATMDGQIHLSTAYTWDSDKHWALAPLFEEGVRQKVLSANDCNYFQIFTIPGMSDSLAFNCPRVLLGTEINPLDVFDTSKALYEGRKSILKLANFCKNTFIGFENAYISNIADMTSNSCRILPTWTTRSSTGPTRKASPPRRWRRSISPSTGPT